MINEDEEIFDLQNEVIDYSSEEKFQSRLSGHPDKLEYG